MKTVCDDGIIEHIKSLNQYLENGKRRYREEMRRTGMDMRLLRQMRKITLREVSRRMNLSAPYISDLERGHRYWTVDVAERYMKACQQ